ncbi:hypothetical protein EDB84DRAFT_1574421, partial [Lactarius hengduanensis]
MPFGGCLAYFAWPLGLLCLHLARLLPGDFSQPSPTAFARAPEHPGRPSLPVVTALGHRSSLAVARDCHARLPPLFSSPPPMPPRTGLLDEESRCRQCQRSSTIGSMTETDSDSVVLSSHSRRCQSTPHPTGDLSRAWAKAQDAS